MDTKNLWVVSVISNACRFKSRYDLYRAFEKRVLDAGANLLTVELALNGRPFQVTTDELLPGKRVRHVQLRGRDEIWHKENLINLGVQNLPEDWEYVAWLDSDIEFVRKDWAAEIVQQLQHYKVIQVFRDALDLGPDGECMQKHNGFMWSFCTGQPPGGKGYGHPHWHPGYGWACDRETFNDLGGLFDVGILGSGDQHMAWALLGKASENLPQSMKNTSPGYIRALEVWRDRASARVRQDVGFMPGTILHHWHGKKKDRQYESRYQILQRHGYDPDFDIQRDWQGVYQLSERGIRMQNDLRAYFRRRNEDSIDL